MKLNRQYEFRGHKITLTVKPTRKKKTMLDAKDKQMFTKLMGSE